MSLWPKHQSDDVNDAWSAYFEDPSAGNLRDAMWETFKAFAIGVPYIVSGGWIIRTIKGWGALSIVGAWETIAQACENFLDSGYDTFTTWLDEKWDAYLDTQQLSGPDAWERYLMHNSYPD